MFLFLRLGMYQVFHFQNGTPFSKSDNEQAYIVATGESHEAILKYSISIDGKMALCEAKNIFQAFDELFKCYWVFNMVYRANLIEFYQFVENYIYGMSFNPYSKRALKLTSSFGAYRNCTA